VAEGARLESVYTLTGIQGSNPCLSASISAQISPMTSTKQLRQERKAQKRKENVFFELAGRFRASDDPEQVKRLGDELGRFVFGE
jgi:hypothetical protein